MTKKLFFVLFIIGLSSLEAAPKVTVSILPIHGLVEDLMKGVGKPDLLLPPKVSPHHFHIKPSQAKMISEAQLFIWIGPELETVLEKSVESLTKNAIVMTLEELDGLTIYQYQNERIDPHLWLDPENAKIIVNSVAEQLVSLDRENKKQYEENRQRLLKELDSLKEKLSKELEVVSDKNFIVYHDAYRYFEKAFGLKESTPLLTEEAASVHASQRLKIEKLVEKKGIKCMFSEPQHGTRTALALSKQLNLQLGELDPLGTGEHREDENSYIVMMNNLSKAIVNCLGEDKKNEES